MSKSHDHPNILPAALLRVHWSCGLAFMEGFKMSELDEQIKLMCERDFPDFQLISCRILATMLKRCREQRDDLLDNIYDRPDCNGSSGGVDKYDAELLKIARGET